MRLMARWYLSASVDTPSYERGRESGGSTGLDSLCGVGQDWHEA